MAETQTQPKQNGQITAPPAQAGAKNTNSQKRGPSIHQIYALPAPIRTFPLPAFYPNNPISLFTVAYAWLRQTFAPPPAEPAVVHQGIWSEKTFSVHITDEKSMRALWEQGFYGKGSLSRSEPNWLKREQVRRGLQETHVSEILTVQRREERVQAKWERARLEQEAIRQTRLKEAQQAEADSQSKLATLLPPMALTPPSVVAPVGPLELLSLPNSDDDAARKSKAVNDTIIAVRAATQAITIPLPVDIVPPSILETSNGIIDTNVVTAASLEIDSPELNGQSNGLNIATPQPPASEASSDSTEDKSLKRQKSVRFSPKVESTTFNLADPPSPHHSLNGKNKQLYLNGDTNGSATPEQDRKLSAEHSETTIVNKEHLQLTPEEAFFLTFGFGALSITDPSSGNILSTKELLTLFRRNSFFPPRTGEPDEPDLEPDDGFLIHYAVYHHFRSLGWVPRGGIKFGVDWLLYTRGPVFDHAEFGLIVIPSYSDPWWKSRGRRGPQKTWHWLHSVVRVLSHVMKSLVLVYVDIPPPPRFDAALETGYAEALKLYKVREIMVKRWSSNRNR